MPTAPVRAPGGPKRMVWDGQSRSNYPAYPGNVPYKLMRGTGLPWSVASVDGLGWNLLPGDDETRLWPLAALNDATGLWLVGGEGDIEAGASAATIITRITTYANNARAAGFAPIAATTVPSAALFDDGTDNARRITYNASLLAMAGGAVFEYVVDIEEGGSGPMVYYAGSPYYDESLIHYSAAGAREVARICQSTHDQMLADMG